MNANETGSVTLQRLHRRYEIACAQAQMMAAEKLRQCCEKLREDAFSEFDDEVAFYWHEKACAAAEEEQRWTSQYNRLWKLATCKDLRPCCDPECERCAADPNLANSEELPF